VIYINSYLPFFLFILLIHSEALASKELSLTQQYLHATAHSPRPEDCAQLKQLMSNKSFSLSPLAKIRHLSFCDPNGSWTQLDKEIQHPALRKSFVLAWYQHLLKLKNFTNAYRLYKANTSFFSLDKKEFETLALGALQSNLSPQEKNELRRQLHKKSPRFIQKPHKEDFTKVAADYRDNRDFDKALDYYRKVINDPSFSDEKRWYAFKGARQTYKLERWSRMDSYIKASMQWAAFLKNRFRKTQRLTKLHHDANIEYIRTLWTEKGQTTARLVLNQLEKDLSGRYSLQLIYWLKGRMAEEKGNYKQAVDDLLKASNEKSLGPRDEERILWSLAWNQRRIGQYKQSQQSLERLMKSSEVTFWGLSKYKYWQAENYASQGQSELAQQAFVDLTEFDGYGYYGALAFRKLNRPFPAPTQKAIDRSKVLALIPQQDRTFFRDLVEVREFEVAGELVNLHVKTNKQWSAHLWLHYLSLLQEAGAYKNFFISYHSLKPEIQSELSKDYPQLLFPRPYQKEVQSAFEKTQVSPALIYSIMKQESGFDVKARSPADAFGLLQLIPQVAKKVAEQAPGIDYQEPSDLYNPDMIIPLGAYNLKFLFQRFKNNFILSVASYNASEKAVRGWVKTRYEGDPIRFIEDIPYEETKGYVKLVMRNYIVYNRFEKNSKTFPFPESCLDGLDEFTN
jgi:soluble lytic murein transglycosylase